MAVTVARAVSGCSWLSLGNAAECSCDDVTTAKVRFERGCPVLGHRERRKRRKNRDEKRSRTPALEGLPLEKGGG